MSLTRLSRHYKEAYTLWNLANQNETAVKTLKLGMIVPTVISLVLRFLFRRDSLPPSKGSLAIYIVTFFPAFFLSNYLVKIGTTRRDPTTGTLISYGEDLNQTGVTEWCFDILYVTCEFCKLRSSRNISLVCVGQGHARLGAESSENGSGGYTWLYVLGALDYQSFCFNDLIDSDICRV